MRRIASILVSGNAALQANSDRHFTASWNESMVAAKYFSKILAESKHSKIQLNSWISFYVVYYECMISSRCLGRDKCG